RSPSKSPTGNSTGSPSTSPTAAHWQPNQCLSQGQSSSVAAGGAAAGHSTSGAAASSSAADSLYFQIGRRATAVVRREVVNLSNSRYRSAVGGKSGHSGPLWGIEEHVAKIQALHGNSGSVDADAVVHTIFPYLTTYGYIRVTTAGRAVVAFCTGVVDFFALCKTQQPKKVRCEARRNFDWEK
ncbi:hypothetical protein THAOC_09137, partial [Thalassiosira oceanica]